MKELPINSRIIMSVFFSQEDGTLRLCMKNGTERRFTGVTDVAVQEMIAAPSPGQHYIEHIRTKFTRLAA